MTTAAVLGWNFCANSFWNFQMDITGNRANDTVSPIIQRVFTGFGLLTVILAIRVFTLGLYPLYDPSESRYAEMGRKMLETGNWVTPLIDYGIPFWGKPPLSAKYWNVCPKARWLFYLKIRIIATAATCRWKIDWRLILIILIQLNLNCW